MSNTDEARDDAIAAEQLPAASADGWLYLEHDTTGGTTRIPAGSPDVLAASVARGWRVVEAENADEALSLPPRVNTDPADQPVEWLELVHPDVEGTNVVPNHPDALAGQMDLGWRLPDPDPDAVADELRELHPRGGRPTAAERRAAEERAAAAAATTEPPAPDPATGNPTAAGDGTDKTEE